MAAATRTPAITVEEFVSFADPIEEVRARLVAYPLGWRQALDSTRPIHRELWLAMDDATRRRFVRDHRREWEIHRSRLAPVVERDVRAWVADGRLELRAARIDGVEAAAARPPCPHRHRPGRRRPPAPRHGSGRVARGQPAARGHDGRGARAPGALDLGIDVHPYDLRVRDAHGAETRPLFALGPIIRGSVWETIAVPEIRLEAVRIAEQVLAP